MRCLYLAVISAPPTFSQKEAPQYRSEVIAQGVGSFVKDTTENGVRQSAIDDLGTPGVKAPSHEVSDAYEFTYPMKRLTPFLLAGVGALMFDRKYSSLGDAQAALPLSAAAVPISMSLSGCFSGRNTEGSSTTHRHSACPG